jgi:hypothetical protein
MKALYFLSLFLIFQPTLASSIVQLKDFLCGCAYCNTVSRHEPLDIGSHMIRCHSWQKGLQKTMEMMRQTKKPQIEIKKRAEAPPPPPKVIHSPKPLNLRTDYKWRLNPTHGWVYASTYQVVTSRSCWIYREDLRWVWLFGSQNRFMYSDTYGWFYNSTYLNRRVIYYYEQRRWTVPSALKIDFD